jgi:hypothetical protein
VRTIARVSEPTKVPDDDVDVELDEDELEDVAGGADFGALPPEINSDRLFG